MKKQHIKTRSSLLSSLAGSLLLVFSSCTSSYVTINELTSGSNAENRIILDISEDIELDTHTGKVIKDSLQRINEISQFLKSQPNYKAKVIVYYSNQLRKHIESAFMIGYNIEKLILENEIEDKRVSHEIEYDESHTYVFYDKHQKVLIYFKK